MSAFSHLVGLPYIDGQQDCYSIARNYYREVWGLHLPNLARPTGFWNDPDLDLYSLYRTVGFKPVFDERWQIGDALLMPLRSPFATHAAVIVEDNRILHHLPQQLSSVDNLRPKWANRATVVVRHPHITEATQSKTKVAHLHEVVDAQLFRHPEFQKTAQRVLDARR